MFCFGLVMAETLSGRRCATLSARLADMAALPIDPTDFAPGTALTSADLAGAILRCLAFDPGLSVAVVVISVCLDVAICLSGGVPLLAVWWCCDCCLVVVIICLSGDDHLFV